MPMAARYVHTNLIAKDWSALAGFYRDVFGCVPVPPERHFAGEEISRGTAVPHARLDGIHLRLPGHGENGPTLEIFSYNSMLERPPSGVNRFGFGHIAFAVEDVRAARKQVIAAGGVGVGEIVTLTVSPRAKVTWCYVTDPEGNVIELQSWSE